MTSEKSINSQQNPDQELIKGGANSKWHGNDGKVFTNNFLFYVSIWSISLEKGRDYFTM